MSVPKDRPQTGPGAPLTTEREQYRRLMAQGMNNHQACLLIGVHPTTGMRWRDGRKMVDHTGKARYYPPIHAEPGATSPRYLSEEERIQLGDLLAAGHTQRSVAAQLGRSPSTISREIRRNISGAGNYRPFSAHRKALARRPRPRAGKLAQDSVLWDFVQAKLKQRWSPQQICHALPILFPGEKKRHLVHENHLPGALRAGTRRTARTVAGPRPDTPPGRHRPGRPTPGRPRRRCRPRRSAGAARCGRRRGCRCRRE